LKVDVAELGAHLLAATSTKRKLEECNEKVTECQEEIDRLDVEIDKVEDKVCVLQCISPLPSSQGYSPLFALLDPNSNCNLVTNRGYSKRIAGTSVAS
jgi:hypothetical protein